MPTRKRLEIPWSILGGALMTSTDPSNAKMFRSTLERMSRGLIGLTEDEAYAVMAEAAAGVAGRVAHEREQWERTQMAFAPEVMPDGALVFAGSAGARVTLRGGQGVRSLVDAVIAGASEKAALEAELQKRGDEVRRLRLENERLESECERLRTRRKKTVLRDAKGQITEVIEAPA